MLGRGAIWVISSLITACLSVKFRIMFRSVSVSSVSKSRSRERGLPSRFVRTLFLDSGCNVGRRAFDIEGDVLISSSSEEGEAFRFRFDAGVFVDTTLTILLVIPQW